MNRLHVKWGIIMDSLLSPLSWLYGKLFAGHPILGFFVVLVPVVLLLVWVWMMAIDKYNSEHQLAESHSEDAPVVVRPKYSSRQTVQVSGIPGNYNDTLYLDNETTMVQAWDATLEEVGMVLTTSSPLWVDKPKTGTGYPSGPDGSTIEFPAAETPGIEIRSARTLYDQGGNYFLFHRFKATTHVVTVGERRFRVTLLGIRDKSAEKHMLIEYTFGISEE